MRGSYRKKKKTSAHSNSEPQKSQALGWVSPNPTMAWAGCTSLKSYAGGMVTVLHIKALILVWVVSINNLNINVAQTDFKLWKSIPLVSYCHAFNLVLPLSLPFSMSFSGCKTWFVSCTYAMGDKWPFTKIEGA